MTNILKSFGPTLAVAAFAGVLIFILSGKYEAMSDRATTAETQNIQLVEELKESNDKLHLAMTELKAERQYSEQLAVKQNELSKTLEAERRNFNAALSDMADKDPVVANWGNTAVPDGVIRLLNSTTKDSNGRPDSDTQTKGTASVVARLRETESIYQNKLGPYHLHF